MVQKKSESLETLMKRIQQENQTEDVELEGTDLVGEACSVFLEFDGEEWTAKLGISSRDIAHFCWMENDELKCDNTLWKGYASPIQSLTALEEQCREHKKHKAILVSYEQLNGDSSPEE